MTLSRTIIPHDARRRTINDAGDHRQRERCGTLGPVHARSALFDLYGDHLLARGGRAPVAALIRLLAPLGVRAPAVRTAVSRMVAQGWLAPVELRPAPRATRSPTGPGSAWTRPAPASTGPAPAGTAAGTCGCSRRSPTGAAASGSAASCASSVWHRSATAPGSARTRSVEVDRLLADEGHRGGLPHRRRTSARSSCCWTAFDVGTARRVTTTLDRRGGRPRRHGRSGRRPRAGRPWPRSSYAPSWCTAGASSSSATRACPTALLPADWPGLRAAAFFDEHAARLLPAADRFIDQCLTPHDRRSPRPMSDAVRPQPVTYDVVEGVAHRSR